MDLIDRNAMRRLSCAIRIEENRRACGRFVKRARRM
jgi:hypothetical protein